MVAPKGIRVGGLSPEYLATKFGSPFYAYDAATIRLRVRELYNAMPLGAEAFFSARANSNVSILTLIAQSGAGVCAASKGELMAVARAGFKPEKIMFCSSAKTAEEITYAMQMNAYSIGVDSVRDAERVAEQAQIRKVRQRIGVRVNPSFWLENGVAIRNPSSKLGIDEEKAVEAIKGLPEKQLNPAGIHIASASGVMDAGVAAQYVKQCMELAYKIEKESGITLEYLQIGLGIGVPSTAKEKDFDLVAFGEALASLPKPRKGLRLMFESGTYLVAEAGIYCTKVIEVRESRGRKFVIVDGGVHHCLRHALMEKAALVFASNKPAAKAEMVADICGPLATPKDTIARNVLLPKLADGETLVFANAGAYGYAEAMPFFESRKAPCEILVDGPSVSIIRKSITEEEMLSMQQKN